MDVTTFATPPTPGTAHPGDLYVDLQSRALWLAVDAAVDPAQFVLISDIEAMLANDAQMLADANAYTDAQIATRAPTVHTHTSSQITDFTPAVTAVVNSIPGSSFLPGMWVGWAGNIAQVGTGDLSGWALCDGRSLERAAFPALFNKIGTMYGSVDSTHFNIPDLRDRFIIGAGNLGNGNKNTAVANIVTDAQGSHTHTVGDTALTVAMLPSHNHGAGSFAFSDTTSAAGGHSHTVAVGYYSGAAGSAERYSAGSNTNLPTSAVGNHTHTVSGPVTGTSSSTGSGATHTHTLTNANAHQHNITAAQVRAAILWMAQAYIIKLN